MKLVDVRVFVEVASCGSLTQAGRTLASPKSSVARQLARLEADLDCRLLARTSRSVTLTDAGRGFLPHARRLLDDADEAERAVSGRGREASGLVTVSATSLIGRRFIAPRLPAFRQRHPHVRIALWLHPGSSELGTGPGEVDVAFRLRSVASPHVGHRRLAELAFKLVAAPGYLDTRGRPDSPEALPGHDLIELGPAGKDNRAELNRGAERRAIRFAPAIQVDEPEAVLAATLAGGGISILPAFLVAEPLGRGELEIVLPGWAPPPSTLNLLYRTSSAPALRVRAFVDFFSGHPEILALNGPRAGANGPTDDDLRPVEPIAGSAEGSACRTSPS